MPEAVRAAVPHAGDDAVPSGPVADDEAGTVGADSLWRAALRVGVLLALPVGAIAYSMGGLAALVSAAAGYVLVVGNAAGGAYLFARTRHGDVATTAAIGFGGYLAKIILLGIAIAVLRPMDVVHGPGLAVGVVVPLIVLLTAQARAALGRPSLWWVIRGRNHG